jgi:hypothetical protein
MKLVNSTLRGRPRCVRKDSTEIDICTRFWRSGERNKWSRIRCSGNAGGLDFVMAENSKEFAKGWTSRAGHSRRGFEIPNAFITY